MSQQRTTEPLPDGGMTLTLLIALVVAVFAIVLYMIIRRRFPRVYFPKDEGNAAQKTLLGWIPWMLLMTDKSLLSMHGPRALTYLAWSRTWFIFLFIMTITSLPLMLVINVLYSTAQGPFARTVTAFLPLDDPLTWVSYGVSIWTLVVFALAMLVHILYTLRLRAQMLNSRTLVNQTLKVAGLSPKQTDADDVKQLLAAAGITPNAVHVGIDDAKMVNLQQKRKVHEDRVEELQEYGQPVEERPKRFKLPGIVTCNGKVDAMEWNKEQLDKTLQKLRERKDKKEPKWKGSGVAFATYDSVEDAQTANKVWPTTEEAGLTCCGRVLRGVSLRPAHSPEEVHWNSLAKPRPRRLVTMFTFNVLSALLAVFFTIPITFLSTLELWEEYPGIGPVIASVLGVSDTLTSLITKTLPAVLQAIFFVLLPIIFTLMASLEHHHSFSSSEASVSLKMFVFTLLNNVILLMLFARALDTYNQVYGGGVDEVQDALRTLDWGVYSSYFCNWLIVYGIISSSLSVLNPVKLILQWLQLRLAKTPKAKRLATALAPYRFSLAYAKMGMTLSIVLLFIPMAPIIVAPAFVCAGMWLLADRTNMGFVSKPASQFDLKGTALFYGFAFVAIIWSEVTWVFFFATHGPRSIVAPAVISYIAFDVVLLLGALVFRIYIIVSDRRRAGKGSNEMAEFVAAGGSESENLNDGVDPMDYSWPGAREL